ncbi:ATP-binding protein [Sulfurimonas sp.]|uniref:ATP-binding protein n=1 Tax=Sulfurimonas sp. TaxID=2022749 RepID=UPI00356A6CA4
MNFYKITVGKRLGLGFSLITLITVFLGIFVILEFKEGSNITKDMFNHPYTVNNSVKDIHADMMTIHAAVLSMMINKNEFFIDGQIIKVNLHDKNIEKHFGIILDRYLGSKSDVRKAYEIYKSTVPIRTNVIQMIKEGNIEEAQLFMNTNGYKLMQSLHKEMHLLGEYSNNRASDFLNVAQKNEKSTINLLIIALVFVVLLSSIIAITIIKSIVDPLNILIRMSEKINKGDFSILNTEDTIDLKNRPDQLGQLYNSFHTLLNYLLLPYDNIIKSNRSLVEITDEVRRLLDSFDKNIIASKMNTQGNIIYVSKAFQNISGYSAEELLGKKHTFINHSDMPRSIFLEIWKTIESGKTWTGEIKNRKKDGSFFWVNANISPDIDKNGVIIGYNVINEETTVTKAFEELSSTLENRVALEIEKNNEKTGYMLQQSRLAQMGEMISMIAHQWRQPLASISAISGTLTLDLMMDNYNNKFFKDRLEAISELSQHLSSTIDDFRTFFKDDKKEEISEVKTIIDESIAIIGQTLRNKNINLIINHEGKPKIKSHLNEIKQVLLNLIKNSEDILLEKHIEEAKIWINVYTKDSQVCINIEDNAGGIPEDIVDKVFDPYFSTKKEKDGTGLGLYMSKTIIQEHCRGKLLLNNTHNGASFTIILPIFSDGEEL